MAGANQLARVLPAMFETRLTRPASTIPCRLAAAPSLWSLVCEVIEAEWRGQRVALSVRHTEVSKNV
jgi:hypothetical protein